VHTQYCCWSSVKATNGGYVVWTFCDEVFYQGIQSEIGGIVEGGWCKFWKGCKTGGGPWAMATASGSLIGVFGPRTNLKLRSMACLHQTNLQSPPRLHTQRQLSDHLLSSHRGNNGAHRSNKTRNWAGNVNIYLAIFVLSVSLTDKDYRASTSVDQSNSLLASMATA
jgi:hypothetical protein